MNMIYTGDGGITWSVAPYKIVVDGFYVSTQVLVDNGEWQKLVDGGCYRDILESGDTHGLGYTGRTIIPNPGPEDDINVAYREIAGEDTDQYAAQREQIKLDASQQMRSPSALEIAEDTTKKWLPDQDLGRYKVLVEELAQTPDEELDGFDGDLLNYDLTEQDYARNLAVQETHTIALDTQLKDSGAERLFTDTEANEARARVAANSRVADGLETGTRTPEYGPARELITLDNEKKSDASFFEIEHEEWYGGTMYHPRCILESIPDEIDPTAVRLMVYDANNVYRGWLRFDQQLDGTWMTPTTTSGTATTASRNWRCAVTNGGDTSEYEVTGRHSLVPPNSAWAKVRWGGRNGASTRGKGKGKKK